MNYCDKNFLSYNTSDNKNNLNNFKELNSKFLGFDQFEKI